MKYTLTNKRCIHSNNIDGCFFVPQSEQEQTPFQEYQQLKKDYLLSYATNQPLILDFSITTPRKGYVKHHHSLSLELVKALFTNANNRKSHPTISSSFSREYDFLIADFDYLPATFGYGWSVFREHLEMMFAGSGAIITPSLQGKAKVWYFFEGKLTQDQKLAFMADRFSIMGLWNAKVEVYDNDKGATTSKYIIDRDGINNSFLTHEMFQLLQEAKPLSNELPGNVLTFQPREAIQSATRRDWELFTGSLPAIIEHEKEPVVKMFKAIAGNLKRAMSGLGIDLPIAYFSEQLNLSTRLVSQSIKRLVILGVIESLQGGSYKPGHHAKSYRFTPFFINWAKRELVKLSSKNSESLYMLKKVCVNGNYNKALFDMAIWFINRGYSLDEYLEFCSSIDGFHDKSDRYTKASYCYTKYSIWISSRNLNIRKRA